MEDQRLPDVRQVASLTRGEQVIAVTPLHGDGSSRRYYRVSTSEGIRILLDGPDHEENGAWLRIRAHLERCGIRVPKLLGADEEAGLILMEDVGEESLFSVASNVADEEAAIELYKPILALLAKMQIEGGEEFSLKMGFAGSPYNLDLMVDMEGGYFLREFVAGHLGISPPLEAKNEIKQLAGNALASHARYFLHRDFQSRNIFRSGDGWVVLDFQGARPGPLGYDLAALILDPYVALPKRVRDALLGQYKKIIGEQYSVDVRSFEESWHGISSFRLMQALGAFGKLGGRLKKSGFLEHSPAALAILEEQLKEVGGSCPVLIELVGRCREALKTPST